MRLFSQLACALALLATVFFAGCGFGTETPVGADALDGAGYDALGEVTACGDGICLGSESCSDCPQDCGVCPCGDGLCESLEGCGTCPQDCGVCACGDGVCEGAGDDLETCGTCPQDCGVCPCGDGVCGNAEGCTTCPQDCGLCPCGDGVCGDAEGCDTCPADCGECTCGDGECDDAEDCALCAADCGACTVAVSSELFDLLAETPLAGFEVCAQGLGGAACDTTDVAGAYEISGLPLDTKLVFVATGLESYWPLATMVHTGVVDGPVLGASIPSNETMMALLSGTGIVMDETFGSLVVTAFDFDTNTAIVGATLVLEPLGGGTPVYLGPLGTFDATLTGTTGAGVAAAFNLAEGAYIGSILADGYECVTQSGWKTDDGAFAMDLPAGALVIEVVGCIATPDP